MNIWQILLIILAVLVALGVVLYFLGKKMQAKMDQQQSLINQHKMVASILVIDKKKTKITNSNLPKTVIDQFPKWYRFRKLPLVKAKIGPQITTFICDEKVFKNLPTKKVVKVEVAGLYIVSIKSIKK
ncbi:MAG: YdgA family protein [Epulopiscium sp.]|nr:YdgA family protein [Candidatus Epulonipiscium sp.]